MKKYIPAIFCLLIAASAFARLVNQFTGWNDLIQRSPDIIVARCTSTVINSGKSEKPYVITDGWIPSDIEVLSVLKGNTKLGPAHIMSSYWPYPGEKFLIFGTYEKEATPTRYVAGETYQIVPLNHYFQTNMLGGQTLDEKINWILQSRLRDLNEELATGNEEKKRLEEGLNTRANAATNSPSTVPKTSP